MRYGQRVVAAGTYRAATARNTFGSSKEEQNQMRNILRQRRTRSVIAATVLAGGLVAGVTTAVHADLTSSSTPTSSASVGSPPAATAATAATAENEATAASCYSTYLAYGSRGTCVKQLQSKLGALTVDGVYGAATRSRVRAFQADGRLTVDGKVGPQTWRKLRTLGKALGWRSGVTVYMCKESSTWFRYSVWNNAPKNAYWRLYTSEMYIEGSAILNNRMESQGTTAARARDSRKLWVWLDREGSTTTTSVRDFSPSTLPACV